MVIRPISFHDRPKILKILEGSGTFTKKEIQVAMEVIDETLRNPEFREYDIFCAVNGPGSLMGYICFGPIPMTEGRYDLYWIAVDNSYWRKGVGKKLMEFMEGFLIKKKARRIYVETSSTPPYEAARSFYIKHGYKLLSVLKDFYREGDHKLTFMKEL
jgi:ribosomal protein S18 acetylase RimI-like enzyme